MICRVLLIQLTQSNSSRSYRFAGFEGNQLNWFKSYMSGRSQSVLWNDMRSNSCHITHSVPQVSILRPISFLIMIADLPTSVISDMESDNMMSYADNCSMYVCARSLDLLKFCLETLSKRIISYCRDTGLILNNEKTH